MISKFEELLKDILDNKSDEELSELSSSDLEQLSAGLTAAKTDILGMYACAQQKINKYIGPAQLREQAIRDQDPEHAKKHQGVRV